MVLDGTEDDDKEIIHVSDEEEDDKLEEVVRDQAPAEAAAAPTIPNVAAPTIPTSTEQCEMGFLTE